jgi:hypothetical protein
MNFKWGGDVSGAIHSGDVLTVFHDFSVSINKALDSTHESVPVSWSLTASVEVLPDGSETSELTTYTVRSDSQGESTGVGGTSFSVNGQALSWFAKLSFAWDLSAYGNTGEPANPHDSLVFDSLSSTPIDLSITSLENIPPVAAPLPATAWMGISLLGAMGIWRIRNTGFERPVH